MKKILLNIVFVFSLFALSQTNQDVRNINIEALSLINDYKSCASLYSRDDGNMFYKLCSSNATIFNDISQSDDYGKDLSFRDYIKVITKGLQ